MPRGRKNKARSRYSMSSSIIYPPEPVRPARYFNIESRRDVAVADGPTYSDDSFERVMSPISVSPLEDSAILYPPVRSRALSPRTRTPSPYDDIDDNMILNNRSSRSPSPYLTREPTPDLPLPSDELLILGMTARTQYSTQGFDTPIHSRPDSRISIQEDPVPQMNDMCLSVCALPPEEYVRTPLHSRPASRTSIQHEEDLVPKFHDMCLSARSHSSEELAEPPFDVLGPVPVTPASPHLPTCSREQLVEDQISLHSNNPAEHVNLCSISRPLDYSINSTPAPEFEKHDRYWFSDGSIVVKVQNTLYNLHRSLLQRHSDWFSEKFLDTGVNQEMIDLEIIECLDFNNFLSFLYPYNYLETKHSVDDWKAILTVATHLQFKSIRELAIQELTTTANMIDRIVLGQSLDIHQWLLPAYIELSEHPDPLTIEEGQTLGLETVIRIAAARERYFRRDTFLPFEFTPEMFGL